MSTQVSENYGAKQEIQKFCKQIKAFFESVETDIYNLRILVASFIEKIKTVLTKNNPVEIIEEFDKWVKFFTTEKRRLMKFPFPLIEYIKKKTGYEIMVNDKTPQNYHGYGWDNKNVINTRQIVTNIFESEAHAMNKIDHPMYFRRRFLKSKLINEEVNELRNDEFSQKNQDYIQKFFNNCLHENGILNCDKVISILNAIPENQFKYKFSKDLLNDPWLIMSVKKKIVFTIRLNMKMTVPKCICVSSFNEITKTGNVLPPEAKSKYKFFKSINNYAIHAMNKYVSYEEIPILGLMEWWRNFANFCEEKCKITDNRLYWS
ncbi:unnamed protein product [Moneuplotes crassus]|uniref:Uncharacterized protein n=1 Tax=Euplotes crassus TaxID=5936 RepID=A0AAD1XJK0_EUPCR|nr:unnamed protein product [Moneuplotes crassus]